MATPLPFPVSFKKQSSLRLHDQSDDTPTKDFASHLHRIIITPTSLICFDRPIVQRGHFVRLHCHKNAWAVPSNYVWNRDTHNVASNALGIMEAGSIIGYGVIP